MTHLTKRQQQVLNAIVSQQSARKAINGLWFAPQTVHTFKLAFSASTLYALIDAGLAVLTEATKAF